MDDFDYFRYLARANAAIELIASTCDVEKNDGRYDFDVYTMGAVNVLTKHF